MSELNVIISAGMQSKPEIGFQIAIKAEGPVPIGGAALAVNGATIEGIITHSVQVLDLSRNTTSIALVKTPGVVIKPGDILKVIVIDVGGNIATKSGIAQAGFSPWMPAYVVVM